ncbi:hypothetical protein Tco_0303778 [Tanacetum coccineum]
MASLDRHLNPLYAIKECSSCGNLHTKNCGWSIESLEDKILVPVPDLTLEAGFSRLPKDTSESSDDVTKLLIYKSPLVVNKAPMERCSLWLLLYTLSFVYSIRKSYEEDKGELRKSKSGLKIDIWKIHIRLRVDVDYSIAIAPVLTDQDPVSTSITFKEHLRNIIDSPTILFLSDCRFLMRNIDYVDASPPDSERVCLEVVEIVIQKLEGLMMILFLTIKEVILDVPDSEASRAQCFVLRSLELQILSFIWESDILILSNKRLS